MWLATLSPFIYFFFFKIYLYTYSCTVGREKLFADIETGGIVTGCLDKKVSPAFLIDFTGRSIKKTGTKARPRYFF